jgi:hypothetical protein
MPAYWATINGENILAELESKLGKYGFFAHRCVIADNPESAEEMAIQLLIEDENVSALVRNSPDDPPRMKLQQLIEIEALDPNCSSGLTWYEMNPKRWWQFWKR